jgi:hypothetical protein
MMPCLQIEDEIEDVVGESGPGWSCRADRSAEEMNGSPEIRGYSQVQHFENILR